MRDWPLLLTAALLILGAAGRYIAADGTSDILSVLLACLGSAVLGAWLYSVGVDKERERT